MRNVPLINEEYYHLYNRGVDKRRVFENNRDFSRFLLSMDLLNDKNDGLMQQWRDFKKANPKAQLSDFPKLSFGSRKLLVRIN